jgi:oligosaccharide repeat unit polymerase
MGQNIIRFNQSKYPIVIFAHVLIIIFQLLSLLVYLNFDFDPEKLIYPISFFLILLFLWLLWSWKFLTNNLFSPYTLFILAAMLFNSGQAFLEVFNLNDFIYLDGKFTSQTILNTLFLVMISLTSLHLGALISITKIKKQRITVFDTKQLELSNQAVRLVGWLFLSISLIPTVYILKDALVTVVSSGYMGLYAKDTATGFEASSQRLAGFLVPAALFLLAGSKGKKLQMLFSILIILSYSLMQFALGYRGWSVLPLIAAAWVYNKCIRPLPRTLLISFGSVMLFIIFPLIKAIRESSGSQRFDINFMINSYLSIDNPVVSIIREMGTVMNTICYTMNLVPYVRNYDFGIGYLYALLTIVPNLFWDLHPSVARGTYAHWLIWNVNPYIASRGGGIGYSFIAEAYINFGWLGTPIFMFILGYLFIRLVIWADSSNNPAKIAMLASFLSFFLFYVRDESTSIIRPLFWYSLIPYLFTYFFKSILKSKKSLSSVHSNHAILK